MNVSQADTPNDPKPYDGVFFAISKSGDRGLDRVGKSFARTFRQVSAEQVLPFLHFNLHGNTVLVAGRVLLQQGHRGVPVGEFLSAQLAEIWAAWREHTRLFANTLEATSLESEVQNNITEFCTCHMPSQHSSFPTQSEVCMACSSTPVQFSLLRDPDCTLSCGVAASMAPSGPLMRSPQVHLATEEQVVQQGFTGLWSPSELPVAFVEIAGTLVVVPRTTHWDGGGRGTSSHGD